MKIVALVPVKNESWALPSYLSSISKIADEIIALNDSSTDSSVSILKAAGATVVDFDSSSESIVNMGKRRKLLLDLGRKAGGTHFIWLDADETFSADFIPRARGIISALTPGQKITMRWVHAWKDISNYLVDTSSPFGYIWKDFIVCDNPEDTFEEKFLSEARTPGSHDNVIKLSEEHGVVIHWQFSRWDITQLKQALYRCLELIEGTRSARRINHTYSITVLSDTVKTSPFPDTWTKNLTPPQILGDGKQRYLTEIQSLFSNKGILFFEGLQIWHVPELRRLFFEKTAREPKIDLFPEWLVYLNKIKNNILHG